MRNQKPSLQPLPGSEAESAARHLFQMRLDLQASSRFWMGGCGHRAPFLFLTWLRAARQRHKLGH